MSTDALNNLRDRLTGARENIEAIVNPWPQTKVNPGFSKTSGFLPPVLIEPTISTSDDSFTTTKSRYALYEFEDWRGQKISTSGTPLDTKKRFNESVNIPKSKSELGKEPYSTRDHYLIFGDTTTDYFRHGLQIIDELTPIENPINGESRLRLDLFKSTPFENNDPVMFGFDIIIDSVSSPLLNGSVIDFLNQYTNVDELAARIPVYEDFKQQFIKFFKTKSTVRIDTTQTTMSRTNTNSSSIDSQKGIFQSGKKAYMNYYIQKIGGLQNLIETNKPGSFKYLADYRKDVITLDFLEDVSLSLATLSHLYKLLYWSKPNGKSMVPENLLRFNCDIIVSETRNFNRVRKAVETGDIEVIKDNVARHVYSLRECQFFFDQSPHPGDIDMGNISVYGNTTVQFDYKYSTVKFERFAPTSGGFGSYVGYNNGSIWKIGNPGARNGSQSGDISVPKFFTVGENSLRQNGVASPLVIKSVNTLDSETGDDINTEQTESLSDLESSSNENSKKLAERIKNRTIETAKSELQLAVNIRTQLLARTINKTLIAIQGGTIAPPRNVYTSAQPGTVGNATSRIFYDVRGDLVGFLGDSLGNAVGGGFNPSQNR
jgi:hypothetical protein